MGSIPHLGWGWGRCGGRKCPKPKGCINLGQRVRAQCINFSGWLYFGGWETHPDTPGGGGDAKGVKVERLIFLQKKLEICLVN